MQWPQTKSWRCDTAASGGTAGLVYGLYIHPPRTHGNVNRDQRVVTPQRPPGPSQDGNRAYTGLYTNARDARFSGAPASGGGVAFGTPGGAAETARRLHQRKRGVVRRMAALLEQVATESRALGDLEDTERAL